MRNHLIGVCIGHSRLINGKPEGGAVSVTGVNEWTFNGPMAREVVKQLRALKCPAKLYDNYGDHGPRGYGKAMSQIAAQLKRDGCTRAIELHFNAANKVANGHEVLYWPRSKNGRSMADAINSNLAIEGLRNRGIKPRGKGDGAGFLRKTHCPANIIEPFFGDNPGDWEHAQQNWKRIAYRIAYGITEHLDGY